LLLQWHAAQMLTEHSGQREWKKQHTQS
jgi:hypothetical protein